MPALDYLSERLETGTVFTGRDLAKPLPEKPEAKAKKPWSKVKPAKFTNDTVKFVGLKGPLTTKQKTTIIFAARKAFAFAQQCHAVPDGMAFEAWQREEAVKAVGCRLSAAKGLQFPALMCWFAELAGQVDQATYWAERIGEEPQRKAMLLNLIGQVIARLPALHADHTTEEVTASQWAWVDTLAQRKFGGPCRQLSASQLGTLHAECKRLLGRRSAHGDSGAVSRRGGCCDQPSHEPHETALEQGR